MKTPDKETWAKLTQAELEQHKAEFLQKGGVIETIGEATKNDKIAKRASVGSDLAFISGRSSRS
jgi:hypothetical protein